MNALAPIGTAGLVPTNLDEAIRFAKAMSIAKAVPEHLQGDIGSCLLIVEQAMRWRMSPFAVAQCTSNIKGKLMYEGKLVASVIETSGEIEGRFDYKFEGEAGTDDRTVTIWATRTGESEPKEIKVRLGDVKTNNDQWKKQPDQQLVYSASRIWARRWTPAPLLGVYTPQEFDRRTGRPVDSEAADTFDGTTIDGTSEPPPLTDREKINHEVPLDQPPATLTAKSWKDWAEALEMAFGKEKHSPERVGLILAQAQVQEIYRRAGEGEKHPTKDRIRAAVDAAKELAVATPEPSPDDAPDWVKDPNPVETGL